jgi:predicted nucleotidyltransferase
VKLKVSEQVQTRLDDLVSGLKKAFGEQLLSIVAHGSATRGGWREGSDVDIIVVLRESSRQALEASANALQGARWSARIETMVLVEHEIARAADVFPVFYDEIQRCHSLLHGADVFKDLKIEPHHLRLRIEQELREVQIRLRRAVVDAQGNQDALRGVVARKIKQVRSPLRALLEKKGVTCEGDLPSVLKTAGTSFGVDIAAISRVEEDPGAAHDALVALLDKAIADVDAMEGT